MGFVQTGTTAGIPGTTTDYEANKQIEEIPASGMRDLSQSDF